MFSWPDKVSLAFFYDHLVGTVTRFCRIRNPDECLRKLFFMRIGDVHIQTPSVFSSMVQIYVLYHSLKLSKLFHFPCSRSNFWTRIGEMDFRIRVEEQKNSVLLSVCLSSTYFTLRLSPFSQINLTYFCENCSAIRWISTFWPTFY